MLYEDITIEQQKGTLDFTSFIWIISSYTSDSRPSNVTTRSAHFILYSLHIGFCPFARRELTLVDWNADKFTLGVWWTGNADGIVNLSRAGHFLKAAICWAWFLSRFLLAGLFVKMLGMLDSKKYWTCWPNVGQQKTEKSVCYRDSHCRIYAIVHLPNARIKP